MGCNSRGGGGKEGAEFEDFEGAIGPVVFPADDEVATGRVVAVCAEVGAFEFEFDANAAIEGFG